MIETYFTGFGIGILLVMLFGILWARGHEKKEWNGGTCTVCPNSPMVWFDNTSQGCRGYRCDECQRRIWISYGVDKP